MDIQRTSILDEIINDLTGTNKNIEYIATSHGIKELSEDDLDYIYKDIFQCNNCGIWCNVRESEFTINGSVCWDCFKLYYAEDPEYFD